jgi:glycosyltransferase involved in cell wall biosynthesis
MSKMLSIIIPVYNARKTLAQAVESIFLQGLKISFEIVIVDDGSSDKSLEEIKKLAMMHHEIVFFSHQKNMGGGATRNTAVFHSKGDIIFCLDSDDVLGQNMLQPMIDLMEKKKCDGVGIHISKKFIGTNINRIAFITEFGYVGKKIPFISLFENSTCSLYSTFLITKKAFQICKGYPTDNGFDTQAMAFRFLANGLVAYTCPGTIYMHRVNHSRSYYIREYEAGRTSENWMKIFEEFFFLFSATVQEKLVKMNLQSNDSLPLEMLKAEEDRFTKSYKNLLSPHIKEKYRKQLLKRKKVSKFDFYWLGVQAYALGQYKKAIEYFLSALEQGLNFPRIYRRIEESMSRLKGDELTQRIGFSEKLNLFHIRLVNDLARIARRFI